MCQGWSSIPAFVLLSEPSLIWGDLFNDKCIKSVESSYPEAVYWTRNLFKGPSGEAGKVFDKELTRVCVSRIC